MRSIMIVILFLVACSLLFPVSSTSAGARSTGVDDTLKYIQGKWIFHCIMLPHDEQSKDKSYKATSLDIKGDHFVMDVDGVPRAGEISRMDGELRFIFPPCCNGPLCPGLEIYKLRLTELTFVKKNVNAGLYFKNKSGNADVLFCFRRKSG